MPTATSADHDVVLLDTSAAIALIIEDHESHAQALSALKGRRLGLAGHAWFETYSVLTRLPGSQRRSPSDVLRLLTHNFPATVFLGQRPSLALGSELASLGVSGGAVYDALVGAAARQHQLRLVSADARALPVYHGLGVDVEMLPAGGR